MGVEILDKMTINFEARGDGTRLDFIGINDPNSTPWHCVLTIENNDTGVRETFDYWNSDEDPYDVSDENITCALGCVCDDALNHLWDEWDVLDEIEGYDDAAKEQVKRVSRIAAMKLQRLGWDEDDMLDVSNLSRQPDES